MSIEAHMHMVINCLVCVCFIYFENVNITIQLYVGQNKYDYESNFFYRRSIMLNSSVSSLVSHQLQMN